MDLTRPLPVTGGLGGTFAEGAGCDLTLYFAEQNGPDPPNSLDEDQNFVFPGTFSPAGAIIFFRRYVKIALPSGSLLGANLGPFGGQIGLEI